MFAPTFMIAIKRLNQILNPLNVTLNGVYDYASTPQENLQVGLKMVQKHNLTAMVISGLSIYAAAPADQITPVFSSRGINTFCFFCIRAQEDSKVHNPYLFRQFGSGIRLATQMGKFALSLGYQNVGVIHDPDLLPVSLAIADMTANIPELKIRVWTSHDVNGDVYLAPDVLMAIFKKKLLSMQEQEIRVFILLTSTNTANYTHTALYAAAMSLGMLNGDYVFISYSGGINFRWPGRFLLT